MAFKDTYRLEKVYYENMWTLLKSLKALKENPSADTLATVNELLDNAIADNESIILIYKNLGELYAEVAQKFVDLLTDLKAIRDDLEMWKNEINEKIDDVNNYLMGHIRDLDDRITSLEGRVSDLEDRMTTAENDIDALEGRMDTAEGDIDALEGRMDTAEDDIDGLQDDVSDLEQNKQDKLTAGFGIEIDANNEISVDTNDVQEKLIAGQNITLTPDTTDPTKTVIDASGGSSYTAGTGIFINNNVISDSKPYDNTSQTGVDLIVENSFNLYEYAAPYYQVPSRKSIKKLVSLSDIENYLASYSDIICVVSKPDSSTNWTYPTNNFQSAINYFKVDFRYSLNNIDHYYDLATSNGILFAGVDIHGNIGLTTSATMTLTRVIQKLYETMKSISQQQIYFDIGILAKYVLNNIPQTNAMQNDDIGLLYNYRMKIIGIK